MKIINPNDPSYYIEDELELSTIPENAPVSTIVWCNADDGFTVYMKTEAGTWNEL